MQKRLNSLLLFGELIFWREGRGMGDNLKIKQFFRHSLCSCHLLLAKEAKIELSTQMVICHYTKNFCIL